MSKVTTIIDIGSNSMRMVVLQKSSRFAFNLINETKSRVKISEGCYENNGNLQEIPMQRAYESLKSFLNISNALKSRKIICVATSALRDAPNSNIFISRIKKDLGLNIKVIDGRPVLDSRSKMIIGEDGKVEFWECNLINLNQIGGVIY